MQRLVHLDDDILYLHDGQHTNLPGSDDHFTTYLTTAQGASVPVCI